MTNIHDVEQLEEQLSGPTPGQTGVAETGYGDDTMSGCCEVRVHQGGAFDSMTNLPVESITATTTVAR